MKKIIIASLLIIIALVAIFYGRCLNCKKLPFETALHREYIYLNNGMKTDITLTFAQSGIFGFGGVNRYFAGYKIENSDQIKFSPIGSTMMAGTEEAMQLERQYFDLLNNVEKVKVFKNKLVLMTNNNKKLKFVEAEKKVEDRQEVSGPKMNSNNNTESSH